MHCDAVEAIRERLPADRFTDSHHEDLLASPEDELARLCGFLGLRVDDHHLEGVRRKLFAEPRRTRVGAPWEPNDLATARAGIARFPCLARYAGSAAPGS